MGAEPSQAEPRNPRTAPRREDVLAMYALAVGEGDGHEVALEQVVDYALSYADDYEVPRWDADPIVIEHGWLDGRCGRCGEDLAAVEARIRAELADEIEAQRLADVAMNDGFGIAWNSAVDAVLRAVRGQS